MNGWQMQPLETNPSEQGMPSLLFYLATSPGAGVRGRTEGWQKAWLPLAVAVGVEACVTLYSDWGEPPVTCRGGGRPACLSRERSSGSWLGLGYQGQVPAWAFRVGHIGAA